MGRFHLTHQSTHFMYLSVSPCKVLGQFSLSARFKFQRTKRLSSARFLFGVSRIFGPSFDAYESLAQRYDGESSQIHVCADVTG